MFVKFKQIRPNRWGDAPDEIVETWVRADSVRCFTPRRDGRTGSRLTFASGGGFPVLEPPPVVEARLLGQPEPEQEPQQQQPQPEEEEEEDSGEE